MDSSSEYLGLLVTFIIATAIAGFIIFLNGLLGPKNKSTAVKREPFECGVASLPAGQSPKDARSTSPRFSVKFYLIAMLFILFDVEIVWLFPWAVVLRELKWTGIIGMFSFIAVLLLGYIYAWKKGALEWEK